MITGLHHITLVTTNAQRNVDFYTKALGLRMIKQTVNFDDPSAYHLYYGDEVGSAGTAITFFEWKHAAPGKSGVGGTERFALSTHQPLAMWASRFRTHAIPFSQATNVLGQPVLQVTDPDGTLIDVVMTGETGAHYTGMAYIQVIGSNLQRTHAFFGGVLGLHKVVLADHVWGWSSTPNTAPVLIYQQADASVPRVKMGAGQTHHFALAVENDAAQLVWLKRLEQARIRVTPVQDRSYFHSIYTNDPDGHIVEIATVPPGFSIDEPVSELGRTLKLPPWLEPYRSEIEPTLIPIRLAK